MDEIKIEEFTATVRESDIGPFHDFVRRITWSDIRKRVESDDEAYQVMHFLEDISRQITG